MNYLADLRMDVFDIFEKGIAIEGKFKIYTPYPDDVELDEQIIDLISSYIHFEEVDDLKLDLKKNCKKFQQETCAICLIDFIEEENDDNYYMSCFHKFHIECFRELAKYCITSCPVCRKEFLDDIEIVVLHITFLRS